MKNIMKNDNITKLQALAVQYAKPQKHLKDEMEKYATSQKLLEDKMVRVKIECIRKLDIVSYVSPQEICDICAGVRNICRCCQ